MHLWSVVITAWTYFTSIFWTTDFIASMNPILQFVMKANPMCHFLASMRDIFLFGTNPSLTNLKEYFIKLMRRKLFYYKRFANTIWLERYEYCVVKPSDKDFNVRM